MKDLKQILINLAKDNTKGYPFSACIVYQGNEYFAVNEVITKNDPTAHAEIQVIRKACQAVKLTELKGAKLYCSGEPCPMCLTAIAWAEIKEIYYIYSYKRAISNNFYYDRSSKEVNKFLRLKRIIKKIGDN